MNRLTLILALICGALLFQTQGTSQVRTTYDKFSDRTTTRTAPHAVMVDYSHHLTIAAYFAFPGKGAGHEIDSIGLVFSSRASEWKFLKNSRLVVIADLKRMPLGEPAWKDSELPEITSQYGDHRLTETLFFKVPPSTLRQIANAKTVEMRLGYTEFTVTQEFLADLQAMIAKFKAAPKSETPKRRSTRLKSPVRRLNVLD